MPQGFVALVKVRRLRERHAHFFPRHCFNPAAVNFFSSESAAGSGGALKLKHVFPCIRFLNSGEMVLVSDGFI